MTAINQLLDETRKAANISSDNELSKRLGVTRAVVSAWRHDYYPVPDERIAQICALGKLDGPEWMARIHAEKAQSPAERALWSKMLTRLAAAAIFLVPLSAFAKAETPVKSDGYAENVPEFVYYVNNNSTKSP
jgi:transcriptional regulator with XRE-family HTH domain